MTKIPSKLKKWPKYPRNLKITKKPLKPKKLSKYPRNLKMTKILPDRIAKNWYISNSSIRIVHDQEWTMSRIITKETNKASLDKNMVYSWRGPPWTIIRSSVEVAYRLQWSRPWTLSMDDDEEWTIPSSIQRTDEHATLGKIWHVGAVGLH